MQPILSDCNFFTAGLSEYIDCYLQYQAKLCNFHIGDTIDFLTKVRQIYILTTGLAVSKMSHVRQSHAIKHVLYYGVRQSHAQKIYGVRLKILRYNNKGSP